MRKTALGELVPQGGGDPIPLLRSTLKIGRRESCDICLRFPNISTVHCELVYKDGYWVIRDLASTNGIKINGERLRFRPLRPGDRITIGKRDYVINYDLHGAGQTALEAVLTEAADIYGQSLMEKAGLTKKSRSPVEDMPGYSIRDDDEFDDDDDDD
ncbi:MAG TPA: FHA domain-containing protein [Gemmataceae bacterium]|nr:FHA domain-containing protein [Gemmataceae bacterium]